MAVADGPRTASKEGTPRMLSNRIRSVRTQRTSQRFIPGADSIGLESRQLLTTTFVSLPGAGIGGTTLLNNAGDIVARLSGVPGEVLGEYHYFIDRIGVTPLPIGYPAGAEPSPGQPLDLEPTALNDAGQ